MIRRFSVSLLEDCFDLQYVDCCSFCGFDKG